MNAIRCNDRYGVMFWPLSSDIIFCQIPFKLLIQHILRHIKIHQVWLSIRPKVSGGKNIPFNLPYVLYQVWFPESFFYVASFFCSFPAHPRVPPNQRWPFDIVQNFHHTEYPSTLKSSEICPWPYQTPLRERTRLSQQHFDGCLTYQTRSCSAPVDTPPDSL